MDFLHSEITNKILKAFFTVCNSFPFGLETSIYTNALALELAELGLEPQVRKSMPIVYRATEVGSFTADIVVNKLVLLRIISRDTELEKADEKLVKNQLILSDIEVSLILNFGIEGYYKRVFLSNDYKHKKGKY